MFKQLRMPKIYDLLVFGAFILIIYIILYRMGSRPRKRKAVNNPGTQSNGNDAASQDMVEKCLAVSKPLGKLSRQLPSTPQPQSSQDNPEFNPSTLLVRPLTQVILPHPNNMNLVWQDQSAWEWIQKLRQNVLHTNLSKLLPSCRSLPLVRMKNSNESRKMDNYFSLNHLRLVKKGTLQLGFRHSTCSWQ